MAARAFITGLAGLTLAPAERAFLREARPWGLILFKRNVSTPEQVTELVGECRAALGWQAPVLVDQEGGRVQRLGPPHWPASPPGARYGELYDRAPALGTAAARLAGSLRRETEVTLTSRSSSSVSFLKSSSDAVEAALWPCRGPPLAISDSANAKHWEDTFIMWEGVLNLSVRP